MELFHDQDFDKIQKKHSELGVPWTDPTFSASDASIGLSKIKDLPHNIQWKRPFVSNGSNKMSYFPLLLMQRNFKMINENIQFYRKSPPVPNCSSTG